jgi:hypothetical protein
MRGENARLGVETITRRDRTARSATKPRSSSSTDQWRTARPERNRLEKSSCPVQGWGAVQNRLKTSSRPVQRWGAVQEPGNFSLRRSKVGLHANQPGTLLTAGETRGSGQLDFVRRLMLRFRNSVVTSDAGLLPIANSTTHAPSASRAGRGSPLCLVGG